MAQRTSSSRRSASPRRRRAARPSGDRTRGEILTAALECFSRSGMADTRVADIAARAGLSPAALYRHFENKRELFEALHRPDLDRPAQGPQRRREEILDAAQRVFGDKGFAAATLDEIASAVGMTRAALYNYFGSKEDLIAAVLTSAPMREALEALWAANQRRRADPEATLRELARVYLRSFRDPRRLRTLRLLLSEGTRDPKVATLFHHKISYGAACLLALHLEQMGFGPREQLPRYAAAFAGMLFSWVVFHRVLAAEGTGRARASSKAERAFLEDSEGQMAARAVQMLLRGVPRRAGGGRRPRIAGRPDGPAVQPRTTN